MEQKLSLAMLNILASLPKAPPAKMYFPFLLLNLQQYRRLYFYDTLYLDIHLKLDPSTFVILLLILMSYIYIYAYSTKPHISNRPSWKSIEFPQTLWPKNDSIGKFYLVSHNIIRLSHPPDTIIFLWSLMYLTQYIRFEWPLIIAEPYEPSSYLWHCLLTSYIIAFVYEPQYTMS